MTVRIARMVAPAVLVAGSLVLPRSVPAEEEPLVPPPGHYRPVVVDGRTFPVARTSWLSVLEMEDDWHDPRLRRIDGRWQLVGRHEGNDITAEEGTPVLSMTAGTVERVGWTFYSGTRVGVRGMDGKYYFYAHLSEVAPGITPGRAVDPGTRLGRVGNTGYGPEGHRDEFPPHLHLGIEGPGGWENPWPLVRRLYRASVEATTRGERRLARLAGEGDRASWDRVVRRLYA
jgi:murein DD-endopeptidase MepM/ murein hydrolase activator NlpD